MTRDIYFAKVPFRNAILQLRSQLAAGTPHERLLHRYGINLVLDVGANKGQYGRSLKWHGYSGRIVSFEPLPDAFHRLQQNRWSFANWQVENVALGAENTLATLNVAGNSQSSSFQPMHDNHVQAAPASAYVGGIEVPVKRLDSIFDQYYRAGDRCFMKLDVQGHEHHVLEGASGCLDRILGIEVELSLVPLYDGQLLWQDAIAALQQRGYQLMTIRPGFADTRTGAMLQADGVFIRRQAVEQMQRAA